MQPISILLIFHRNIRKWINNYAVNYITSQTVTDCKTTEIILNVLPLFSGFPQLQFLNSLVTIWLTAKYAKNCLFPYITSWSPSQTLIHMPLPICDVDDGTWEDRPLVVNVLTKKIVWQISLFHNNAVMFVLPVFYCEPTSHLGKMGDVEILNLAL